MTECATSYIRQNRSSIYMRSDLITQQDDIKVIEIKDYIKNPKSNGYRSYHMIAVSYTHLDVYKRQFWSTTFTVWILMTVPISWRTLP